MTEKREVLRKLNKNSVLVTDIASQFWCERQMEFNYLYGKKYTEAMRKGSVLHEGLQAEVYATIDVEPITYADFLYKEAYENYLAIRSLNEKGIGREIRIYGSLNGYRMSGKVDELRIKNGKVIVTEVKTRDLNARLNSRSSVRNISEVTMRPHRVQVMLYKRMLDDIKEGRYTYENLSNSYALKTLSLSDRFVPQLKLVGINHSITGLETVYKMVFEQIHRMPEISNSLELHYVDRYTGNEFAQVSVDYTREALDALLVDAMGYWNGERDSRPVIKEESWKCNFCRFFGKECKVWWSE
jgi:exonuclease V